MGAKDRLHEAVPEAHRALQADRLGQKTAEIVHDFNNLLQGLVGALGATRGFLAEGRIDEAQRLIEDMSAATLNAATSTRRLLGFVQREPTDAAPLHVNGVVTELLPLMRGALGEKVDLRIALSDDLRPVVCDRNALENALLNLAINARDAMADNGGVVTIATSPAAFGPSAGPDPADAAPLEYICIAVTDTGPGMTEEVQARAFEPFFTTKPAGKGTGLGLSMVAGFARRSRGWIKIESVLGEGTTVRIHLPVEPSAAAEAGGKACPSGSAKAPAPARGQTILVVEDEMVVRTVITGVLRDRGYHVLEAADGAEGLDILMGSDPIDLLISDISLPGLGGREMAEVARAQRPELKVLFMTGNARDADSTLLGGGAALITKPFTMEELATRAGETLGGA